MTTSLHRHHKVWKESWRQESCRKLAWTVQTWHDAVVRSRHEQRRPGKLGVVAEQPRHPTTARRLPHLSRILLPGRLCMLRRSSSNTDASTHRIASGLAGASRCGGSSARTHRHRTETRNDAPETDSVRLSPSPSELQRHLTECRPSL